MLELETRTCTSDVTCARGHLFAVADGPDMAYIWQGGPTEYQFASSSIQCADL